MDPILLAMLQQLQGSLQADLTSVLSGIENYEVDGLELKITLKDGTERIMEFPQPVNVDQVELTTGADEKTHLEVSLADGTKFDCGVIPAGMSAYDIAVEHGYEGTEAEWLATLPGRHDPSFFEFDTPSADWKVQHNMNDKYVKVLAYDEDGDEIIGDIERVSANLLYIHFEVPITGKVVIY